MPGSEYEHHLLAGAGDGAIEVGVGEGDTGHGAPVPDQPRFDVFGPQGFGEQGIVGQIELPDGEVVRRPPPGVQIVQIGLGTQTRAGHVDRHRGPVSLLAVNDHDGAVRVLDQCVGRGAEQ